MTEAFLQIEGKIFPDSERPIAVELTIQVYGGPYTIRLATQQGVSLNNLWNAISQKLNEHIGISLPDLSSGPWSAIIGVDPSTMATPTAYIGPSQTSTNAGSSSTTAYLGIEIDPPIQIGGGSHRWGPVVIELTPQITIHAMYITYDNGLNLRLKISTPTTTGPSQASDGTLLASTAGPDKFQIVTYPFPIPAQPSTATKAFEFRYLGLGQRVGPDPVVNVDDPMETIFHQLETQFTATDPKSILTDLAQSFYKPDRNWFVAAHVIIVGWDIKLLFNDPAMYGLRISVPMVPLTPFAGLLFEIIYQKLSPNLGVYYGALTLPYLMRRIILEGVILILPGFAIWIYTNGDFRVNVGWPLGDSSIGIQVGVLMGIAGFYFAKLRSGDNPGATPSVNYNPILLFGIGISVYVKQSFSASIFSASIAVSLTATMQGLLAWQSGSSAGGPPDHYWFAGTAGLSVLIEGSVDFSILSASVTISLQANVTIAFETGYATLIAVSADVSVSVRVKVLFFHISLSFSMHISHDFVIGSGAYASFAAPLDPSLSPFVTPAISAAHREARHVARELMKSFAAHHGPVSAFRAGRMAAAAEAAVPLDVYFILQRTALYTEAPTFACIASLFIEAPVPGASAPQTAFELLVRGLIHWLYNGYSDPSEDIGFRLAEVAEALGAGSQPPGPQFGGFTGFEEKLKTFLYGSFAFHLHGVDGDAPAPFSGPSAVLPMFDNLALTYPQSGSPNTAQVDFSTFNTTPLAYPQAVSMYFQGIHWSGSNPVTANALRAGAFPGPSMASFLMADYYLLLTRQVIAGLRDLVPAHEALVEQNFFRQLDAAGPSSLRSVSIVADFVSQVAGDGPLDTLLDSYNFASAAGLGSRFLLNGLQLPDPTQIPATPTPQNMRDVPTVGLYVLTGQQFDVPAGMNTVVASLSEGITYIAPQKAWGDGRLRSGVHLAAASGSPFQASTTLQPPVPPMPAPQWEIVEQPSKVLAPGVVTLSGLPPISAQALYYSLKNQTAWQAPATAAACTILPLPPQLMQRLAATPGLLLDVTADPPAEHLQKTLRGANASGIPAAPSLLIRMTLTQVPAESVGRVAAGSPTSGSPSSQSPKYLPFVYQLGGTDEQTRDLMHAALQGDLSGCRLSLLYSEGVGFASQLLAPTTLVAKTNLSTVNQAQTAGPVQLLRALAANETPTDFAAIGDVPNFLRLLWEVSVVNAAGYFLFYEDAAGQDLPATLFESSGSQGSTGELQVLLSFQEPAPNPALQACQNSVWIAQPPTTGTLFGAVLKPDSTPVPQWGPTYPAGSLGFKVEWNPNTPSPAPPLDVDELYQLLQYSIVPGGGYSASNWSLPAGPTNPTPDVFSNALRTQQDWIYTKTLPVADFFTPGSSLQPSRYAIMGNPVTTAFRFDDLFGNVLPTAKTMTVTPLYNDPLIALGEWPGVQIHYQIYPWDSLSGGLAVRAIFDPESLTPQHSSPTSSPDVPAGDTATQQWQSVLDRYLLILDQLLDPNTTATLTCSLNPAPDNNPSAFLTQLQQYAELIIEQVRIALAYASPSGQSSPAQQVSQEFRQVLPFAQIRALPSDISPVAVSVNLSRPIHLIDPTVAERMPSVAAISYAPAPELEQFGSPSGSPSALSGMAAFAQLFEQAFQGFDGSSGSLKLAQSSGLQSSNDSSDLKPLWAVRWSKTSGIDVSFPSEPVYFALRPLSTSLISSPSKATSLVYSNIDLDAWAYEFVRAFDDFMQPRNAVAVAVLDQRNSTSYFNRLLAAKTSLSQSIPQGIERLLQDQEGLGDLDAAKTSLTQALLTALSNTFSVSTILQAPTLVQTGKTATGSPVSAPPRLWGTVGPPLAHDSAHRQYSFSNGEVELASGPQVLTSLVSVQDAAAQSQLQLPLSYQITYLQNNFQKEVDGYVASSWIKFILDADPQLLLSIEALADIPIPLPFYPGLPRLVSQTAAASPYASPTSALSPNSVENEIADALRWEYTVIIGHDWATQDQLLFTVEFNLPPKPQVRNFAAEEWSLFDALSYFVQQYGIIFGQLNSIPAEAYPGGALPSPGQADFVIDTFTQATEHVAKAWSSYWALPVMATAELGPAPVLIDDFYLSIQAVDSSMTVSLFGASETGANPEFWPTLTPDGCVPWTPDRTQAQPVASPGRWWELRHTFKNCTLTDMGTITLEWHELDVLTRQNATLTAQVVRNANLLEDSSRTTNTDFVYRTAEVSFANSAVPLIQRAALAPVTPPATLTQTIEQLLTPMVRLASNLQPTLRIGVTYDYDVAPTLPASIAVLLADNIELGQSGSPLPSIAHELAEELAAWQARVAPSTSSALLVFSLTVFGTLKGERLPIVQIARIPIEVSAVPNNWWS
jgi:hypothetical protein